MRAIILVEAQDDCDVLDVIAKALEQYRWKGIKKIELFRDTELGADKEHREFM